MTSLVQRNGYYYARFHDVRCSPKQKRLSLRTTRKREARHLLSTREQDVGDGVFDPWASALGSSNEDPIETTTPGDPGAQFLNAKRRTGRSDDPHLHLKANAKPKR
jgi:hypothetical protein